MKRTVRLEAETSRCSSGGVISTRLGCTECDIPSPGGVVSVHLWPNTICLLQTTDHRITPRQEPINEVTDSQTSHAEGSVGCLGRSFLLTGGRVNSLRHVGSGLLMLGTRNIQHDIEGLVEKRPIHRATFII